MRADQARTISVCDYLAYEGHKPQRERKNGKELWYQSPIRQGERTPSFKVDTHLNRWYDYALGEGGNTLDLAVTIHQASVRDALRILERSGLYDGIPHGKTAYSAGKVALDKASKANGQNELSHVGRILEEKKQAIEKEKARKAAEGAPTHLKATREGILRHPALLEYLAARKIDLELAHVFLKEVHFTNQAGDKKFFGIGWPIPGTESYEVRNKMFKGVVGPDKDLSHLPNESSSTVIVFEGFFDFLAYMSYHGHLECPYGAIILGSTALKAKAVTAVLEARYKEVRLFLDNDATGDLTTEYFENLLSALEVHDERQSYSGFKDFNEWLIAQL